MKKLSLLFTTALLIVVPNVVNSQVGILEQPSSILDPTIIEITNPLPSGENPAVIETTSSLPSDENPAVIETTNSSSSDTNPPVIEVTNPFNGDVLTEPALTLIFSVSDDNSVQEVYVNGVLTPVSPDGEYFIDLTLTEGENYISISAIDTSGNESSRDLIVGYVSLEELGGFEDFEDEFNDVLEDAIAALEGILELTDQLIEELEDKEIIDFDFAGDFIDDLSNAFIDSFFALTEGLDEIIDLTKTVSVEIENAPEIPEGDFAVFEFPEFEDFDFFGELEDTFEIPKGFSFATDISFEDFEIPETLNKEDLSEQNTSVLVDSKGMTFLVGFGFLNEVEEEFFDFRNKNYRYQTESGNPLGLTTTITIPADAAEGDATVSILNKNESLATIPLKVAPPREVKVGKRLIGKPQIDEPVTAVVKKNGKQLSLKIKGKNFVQKVATIDGKLERLIGKANLTNVTFVPSEGIKVKKVKVRKNSVNVIAEIKNNIEPGIKLFNVITPKGADIGAIVIPEELVNGKLETTTTPEELILE